MRNIIRVLNTLVAAFCIFIVILIIWFFYLTFAREFSGAYAVDYICAHVASWWRNVSTWFVSLFN